MSLNFEYTDEVKDALHHKLPVLALESTLITHGLPYPDNIQVARDVEALVRKFNVVPATIALMSGKIKIGLNDTALQQLVDDNQVAKASKRDIPFFLSQKKNAGTTVAATMFCAEQVGIQVFATGGIGGVHHGDADDISADLITLANTPMAVICAGAKAILNLPRTLEFLETYSVPIIGYRTNHLPAFYTAQTSHPLTCRVEDIASLVSLLKIHWQLGLKSSMLIVNPIEKEDEIPAEVINPVIQHALIAANEQKILGKDVTPFLLKEIASVTAGKSMAANISLIKNNVRLGAELASSLSLAGYHHDNRTNRDTHKYS